jgi:hypothetical protein
MLKIALWLVTVSWNMDLPSDVPYLATAMVRNFL